MLVGFQNINVIDMFLDTKNTLLVASVEHGEPPFYDTISNTIYACT
jgi:hypothetical protein